MTLVSIAAPRLVLRQSRAIIRQTGRRHASATAQATDAASSTATKSREAASEITSKASQGLSRVTSAAGPAIGGAAQGISRALGRIGGRTGRVITFVESLIPPTIYYSKVGFELSKIIFRNQRMSPPPLEAFRSQAQPIIHAVRNSRSFLASTTDTATLNNMISQIRSTNRQQLATMGIVAAECLGFFTVGEMIGRMKIIGYHGPTNHH